MATYISQECARSVLVFTKYKDYHTMTFEPPRDKTNKMTVRPAKTQISLGIHSV